ncbi:efflux transporter outer membrane subunit [Pseudomonas sp. B35(2017)]|uniref:efflux transporter outer membrane subunit n=1 Tax=Pseudomonas sp. B35(2017) TaxID=1981722 RepID=UPI000A1F8606|nr:efflux transporter outer membrane subunit [Pseudomonas sp. B35(2017)]
MSALGLRYAILCGLSLLAACTVGPDFTPPQAPERQPYWQGTLADPQTVQGQGQRFVAGGDLAWNWWTLFGSPPLDGLVRQAIERNPTLEAAQASLRQSHDLLQAGQGVYYPQVGASLAGRRQRGSAEQPGLAVADSVFSVVTLGATVRYVLDVAGGQRRAVEGLQAQADLQTFRLQAAYLALTGNVVNTAIARAAYGAQVQATERLIGLLQQQLSVADAQVRGGTLADSAQAGLRSLIATNEAQLADVRLRFIESGHLLASLAGAAPNQLTLPDIPLDSLRLPHDLSVSLPSQLVRQRPDIRMAEAQLHQASAAIGVATAALFPGIELTGSYGTGGTSLGSLFSGRFWSIGPTVDIPLFQGGRLWFERKAALEAYRQADAAYRQVVLSAFSQVADLLDALQLDALALQKRSEAAQAADAALQALQVSYRAGLVPYIDVLVADVQLQQADIALLEATAQRRQATAALFVALGGGGWNGPAAQAGKETP